MSVAIKTGVVRFSYAHVFTPREDEKGEKKYSVTLLIPKTDTVTVNAIKAGIKELLNGNLSVFGGKFPHESKYKSPLRDGDVERDEDPAFAGHWFINATAKRQPGLVDADRMPIIDEKEFYSGCYGRATFNLFFFNFEGKKGIGAGLNNIQKLKDGERFGGGSSAEDDFADDASELIAQIEFMLS